MLNAWEIPLAEEKVFLSLLFGAEGLKYKDSL